MLAWPLLIAVIRNNSTKYKMHQTSHEITFFSLNPPSLRLSSPSPSSHIPSIAPPVLTLQSVTLPSPPYSTSKPSLLLSLPGNPLYYPPVSSLPKTPTHLSSSPPSPPRLLFRQPSLQVLSIPTIQEVWPETVAKGTEMSPF